MVHDDFFAIATNVKVGVTLGGVKVNALSIVWDIGHGLRLHLRCHEVREHLAGSGLIVASDKLFVAERRVFNNDIKEHCLRVVHCLALGLVRPTTFVDVAVELSSSHGNSNCE
tara:strand:+ start:293 stop:631 length:339 start_codon:yes stop_codon:yes gene_type:complete